MNENVTPADLEINVTHHTIVDLVDPLDLGLVTLYLTGADPGPLIGGAPIPRGEGRQLIYLIFADME